MTDLTLPVSFLGYTATNQNITYLDLDLGIVKSCHHAIFDEAWYLQPTRPPAAQLLYDLGLEVANKPMTMSGPLHPTPIGTITPISVAWPPLPTKSFPQCPPPTPLSLLCLYSPLPLCITDTPQPNVIAVCAAWVKSKDDSKTKKQIAVDVVAEYLIGQDKDLRLPGPVLLSL